MARAVKDDAAPPEEEEVKVNRREFLNLAWLASLGFFLVPVGGVTILFAFPRFKEGEFGGVFNLGGAENLPQLGQSPVAYTLGKFWLTHSEDGIRAIYKVCTHLGCLYNWQEQEFKFICPCHGSQFDYESVFIQGPAPRSLDLFRMKAVRRSTGEEVEMTDAANEAMPILDDPDIDYLVDTGDKINGKPIA